MIGRIHQANANILVTKKQVLSAGKYFPVCGCLASASFIPEVLLMISLIPQFRCEVARSAP
jgi:hypothetical protein